MTAARKLIHDDSGVTSIEYALIAALVVIGYFVILQTMGGSLSKLYSMVNSHVSTAA